MDTFEKEMAKKQLEILKTINRNLNYIGRKIEMIDSTLQKHGIAIMPGAEAAEEEPEKVVRLSDIIAWKNMVFSDFLEASKDDPNVVIDRVNRMGKYFEKEGKIVKVNIQKGE